MGFSHNQHCKKLELFERALKYQSHRGPDSDKIIEDGIFIWI